MSTIKQIRGINVDLDEIAEELELPVESLMKYERAILQQWVIDNVENAVETEAEEEEPSPMELESLEGLALDEEE